MLRDGITCHELSASGFIHALWEFLTATPETSIENLAAFYNVFS